MAIESFGEKKIPRQLSARSSLVTCAARLGHLSLFTLRTRCPRKCPRVYLLQSRSHKSHAAAASLSACPRRRTLPRGRPHARVYLNAITHKRAAAPGNPAETRTTARLTAANIEQSQKSGIQTSGISPRTLL